MSTTATNCSMSTKQVESQVNKNKNQEKTKKRKHCETKPSKDFTQVSQSEKSPNQGVRISKTNFLIKKGHRLPSSGDTEYYYNDYLNDNFDGKRTWGTVYYDD